LSLVERITLYKSAIVTVPLYLMQSFFIPKSIWFEIEKICLRFIWGDNDGRSLYKPQNRMRVRISKHALYKYNFYHEPMGNYANKC
jgi:hypothetical protein